MRVYEIAAECGVMSKDLRIRLRRWGVWTTSPSADLPPIMSGLIIDLYRREAVGDPGRRADLPVG